jgi:hypothetical protein
MGDAIAVFLVSKFFKLESDSPCPKNCRSPDNGLSNALPVDPMAPR